MGGAGGVYAGRVCGGEVAGAGRVEEAVVVVGGVLGVDGAGAGAEEGRREYCAQGLVVKSARCFFWVVKNATVSLFAFFGRE